MSAARWPLPQRLAALALVPAILLLLGFLQSQQFDEARELRRQVDQSFENRARIVTVLSIHQDMETGQRGYVVTGNPLFLEPYNSALTRLPSELASLRAGIRDEPEFRSAAQELAELSSRQHDFSGETVRLRREGRAEAAAQLIGTGRGKAIMDAIRKIVSRMDRLERARLDASIAKADASRRLSSTLTFLLEGLLLLLLGGAAWAISRSMTATRSALTRLSDLSVRQQAIFDAATDGMITHDPHGIIESLNPAATRLYGYEPEELIGQHIGLLFEHPPERAALEKFLAKLAADPKGRAAGVQEFGAQARDGRTFDVDVATSPVSLGDGLHFVAVIRDVTERKRVERMKTEFVSTVSHELRTPLTSIAGSLGLLAGGVAGTLPERAEKLIAIAHSNSQRLVRLINDILDIEKIESGKVSFDIKPVPLRPLVEQAIQANLAYAAEYGVSLKLEAAGGNPTVLGDSDRLMQVLTNLLSNASKFSPAGSEVVTKIVAGDSRHRITVIDHGSGIPEEFRERMFSKFAQADASDTRQKGGTGLGLNIVKQIVERLGGTVSFDSEDGNGTAFHIDLPAAGAGRAEAPQPNKARVLICHEDAAAADKIKRRLRRAGLVVDVAASGGEARALTAAKIYAVIVLDLSLPGEQSIGLISDLRGDPRYASTAILVASPDGTSGDVSQALSVIDWIHKPVSVDRLLNGVQEAVAGGDRPCILHVEDDADILRVVAAAFEGRADVDAVVNIEAARAALANRRYDLVILDLALPGGSGLDLLPELHRDGSPIPVVIFSAQDEDPELAKRVGALLTKSRASLNDLVGTVEALMARSAARRPKES